VTAVTADPALRRDIPDATVARLPEYLRALTDLADRGISSVASEELSAAAGVRSAQLRKDLSYLGSYGVRGVGYEVDLLAFEISRELGLTQDWPVAIVGLGNLGHALAAYSGFATRGFRVVALLDRDRAVVGRRIAGLTVRSIEDFAPSVLSVPDGVDVRKVDLATELQILAFHGQRKALAAQVAPLARVAP